MSKYALCLVSAADFAEHWPGETASTLAEYQRIESRSRLMLIGETYRGQIPKPTKRKTMKGRKARAEQKIQKAVRAACVARDGLCRLGQASPLDTDQSTVPGCSGPSEWHHLLKRSRTRGQAPEVRHTTSGSCLLCRFHHADAEAGRLHIKAFTEAGADGPLLFT